MGLKEQLPEDVKTPVAEPIAPLEEANAQTGEGLPDSEAGDSAAEAEEQPASQPRRKGGSGVAGAFALLVAAGAGAGGYYLWDRQERTWQQAEQTRAALGGQIAEVREGQSALQGALRTEVSGIQEQLSGLQNAIGDSRAEQQALEQRVQAMLRRIEAQAGDERRAWIVAEAEYLLRVANRRLQMESDIDSAAAALNAADQRLQEVADPAFLSVRRAISDEINALRALGRMDIDGIALQLASIARSVAQLPLKESYARQSFEAQQEAADKPRQVQEWRQFLAAVWEDIKGLVTIRHEPTTLIPRLPPEQQYFLRQNLMLKLETARLALLDRREQIFQTALDESATWLNTYFDVDAPAIASALETIGELRQVAIAPALPDITASLRQLQAVSDRLSRQEGRGGSQ